jgi:hypothetical protein
MALRPNSQKRGANFYKSGSGAPYIEPLPFVVYPSRLITLRPRRGHFDRISEAQCSTICVDIRSDRIVARCKAHQDTRCRVAHESSDPCCRFPTRSARPSPPPTQLCPTFVANHRCQRDRRPSGEYCARVGEQSQTSPLWAVVVRPQRPLLNVIATDFQLSSSSAWVVASGMKNVRFCFFRDGPVRPTRILLPPAQTGRC